jgi:hypothetical protein
MSDRCAFIDVPRVEMNGLISEGRHERPKDRMQGPSIDGSHLRLKQSGHEKRMLREFNGFHASVLAVLTFSHP